MSVAARLLAAALGVAIVAAVAACGSQAEIAPAARAPVTNPPVTAAAPHHPPMASGLGASSEMPGAGTRDAGCEPTSSELGAGGAPLACEMDGGTM